jgi:hypothetical protein
VTLTCFFVCDEGRISIALLEGSVIVNLFNTRGSCLLRLLGEVE